MAVANTVTLRSLTNHPSASAYSTSSPTYTLFSEDWNKIRSTLTGGSLGIKTYSVWATSSSSSDEALLVAGLATLSGNVAVGGTLTVTGASTFTGDITSNGALTAASTLAVTGAATFNGTMAVNDDVTIANAKNIDFAGTGTVDGVDVSAHTHAGGGSNGAQIALGGYAAGSIVYADIKATSTGFGTASSTIAKGENLSVLTSMFDGVTHVSPGAMVGMTNAATMAYYDISAGSGTVDFNVLPGGSAVTGFPCVEFSQVTTAETSSIWATCTAKVPEGATAAGSFYVTAQVIVQTAPSSSDTIDFVLRTYPITTGSSGDTTAVDFGLVGTSTTTSWNSGATVDRIIEIQHTITTGNFAVGDIIAIGFRRKYLASLNSTEKLYLAGITVHGTPLYV